MTLSRDWATPLAGGAFLLVAVTGVLIFFHVDSGLNKTAHEWLSWLLLAGVGLHLAANFAAFRRHLAGRRGRFLVGAFALLLTLSFIAPGGADQPPFAAPVGALARAPLTTLAEVARLSPDQLRARLARAGVRVASERQSLTDLVGSDLRAQMRVLGAVFAEPEPS